MTPYTKKIVELHKIHKAIENCGHNKDDGDSGSGGDTPSEEVTIDDVVKFMHDIITDAGYGEIFPYETWNEIPNANEPVANTVCKSTTSVQLIQDVFLNIPGYIIGTPRTL